MHAEDDFCDLRAMVFKPLCQDVNILEPAFLILVVGNGVMWILLMSLLLFKASSTSLSGEALVCFRPTGIVTARIEGVGLVSAVLAICKTQLIVLLKHKNGSQGR